VPTTPPPDATPPSSGAGDRRLFPTGRHDIHELLDVQVVEAGPERVVLSLPVTWKVHQPYGILHGGVSALLAESAASFGAALAAGPDRRVVGIELNASHLRSVQDGHLTATATPLRVGRTVQVWSIAVSDDAGRAICAARCTLAVLSPPVPAEEPAGPAGE
jgi:1,4-dihydroxy-2-naphthoyl-CoA hydrolase